MVTNYSSTDFLQIFGTAAAVGRYFGPRNLQTFPTAIQWKRGRAAVSDKTCLRQQAGSSRLREPLQREADGVVSVKLERPEFMRHVQCDIDSSAMLLDFDRRL